MGAANLDGEAGAQLFQRIGAGPDFVIRGNAGGRVRPAEPGPGQFARMSLNDLARCVGGFENGHHPWLRFEHGAHVHDFGQAGDIGP